MAPTRRVASTPRPLPPPPARAQRGTSSLPAAAPESKGWAPARVRLPRLDALQAPDFAYDGKVVDVRTGKASDFSLKALRDAVYTPRGAVGRPPLIFTEGANQSKDIGAERARRHADRLGLPIAIVHNASFVKETPGQHPVLQKLNRAKEGVANLLLNKDLVSEQSVKNLSVAMLDAVESGKPAFFGGESQGSILVGQAVKAAQAAYLQKHAPSGSKADVARATAAWETKAGQNLHVITFGNAYASYPKGPNYLHVLMKGDPVPNNGSRPDNRPPDAKTQYLVFDQLFAGKDNFENHNIVVLNELLKRTAELNGVPPGDLPALFAASQQAQRSGKGLTVARPDQVTWPADVQRLLWDQQNDLAKAVAAYRSERR